LFQLFCNELPAFKYITKTFRIFCFSALDCYPLKLTNLILFLTVWNLQDSGTEKSNPKAKWTTKSRKLSNENKMA